tara:strand:+ start:8941 stop:11136 length:2196 start_codon:yes stop_codon:yes gene_type:complete
MASYIKIPTWNKGVWEYTEFDTRDEYKDFVLSLFKEPGKYEFNETSLFFNSEAQIFREQNFYCVSPMGSKDYRKYWDDEKEKCRYGAIFKDDKHTWYLSREYYMWLNFLPINDKEKRKFDFPTVRDAQYHMALYELLAELNYQHVAILKKRQIASSYFHCAKMLNLIWFEETPIVKMGASLKDYINEKGSWKFLNEYKSFLDLHTAWYRPMNPGKIGMWQQQIEQVIGGRKSMRGLKGVLQGVTFEKDPTSGVGGPCTFFFHEEAGIAPKMDITVEFLFPAMSSGMLTTGLFVAAGSVGDLDQCQPLKQMILYPDANSIYAVESDLLDDKGTIGKTGLFIPEQWSMPPFIDQYGNSLVKESNEAIDNQRIKWKKDLTPEQYQLRISQHPKNIAEAFAFRKLSKFPLALVGAQKRRIEEKEYPYEFINLERDVTGKIEPKLTNKLPISEFPITKNTEDKTGVLVVWERPQPNSEWGTYYASIDPVGEGKTTTSESLCSIYVYKNPIEVTRVDKGETTNYTEQDKIVAAWCGRFDDINKTHERLELIIEWYNAWAIIESNISHFINYMIQRKKQKYLVPKSQILFLKDLGSNTNVFQEYGWKNTGVLFKNHMLSYLIEYLKEEIDYETKDDGTIVKTVYGVERIPDIMAFTEMIAYDDDVNVDRLVSLAALISFAKVQQANRGFRKRVDQVNTNNLQKSDNLYKLNTSPFRHMGKTRSVTGMSIPRSPFKNMR